MNIADSDMANIHIVASDTRRIDPVAIEQLRHSASLAGIERVVGLPDLHAGRGIAVGAAFWSPTHVYPHLVGSDIGCGMALWESRLALRKFKPDMAERRLQGLDTPLTDEEAADLPEALSPADVGQGALGTIGGGNHFAELLKIETVVDAERFAALGGARDRVWLMVHSGSRGWGQAILDRHAAAHGSDGLSADSEAGRAYRAEHDRAMAWAVLNRLVIARRFCARLAMEAERHLDICHNSVTPYRDGWLHRKGAAPADRGLVVIPGSRGDFSYLVAPDEAGGAAALHSLAHGAGRKWSRSDAHARLSVRYRAAELERTPLGSRVICEDRRLIYEEAPQAYKDIGRVIADLEGAGLVHVVAILRPLISYKMRRS